MTFRALALVGMTGLTLAALACGGSSGANGSGSSSASDSRDPVAWSACMRSHGVPTFPDPDSRGRIQIASSIDDRLPTVRAAYRACRNLAPSESSLTGHGDVIHQDQLLAFARCMRSHGVPNFPGPQIVNGHIRIGFTPGQIDPSSAIVTAAMATCRSTLKRALWIGSSESAAMSRECHAAPRRLEACSFSRTGGAESGTVTVLQLPISYNGLRRTAQ
jgi:hypothetical protein